VLSKIIAIFFGLVLSNSCIASVETPKVIKSPDGNIVEVNDFGHIYLWAKYFQKKDGITIAAVGRPSAPIYQHLKDGLKIYTENIDEKSSIEYGELEGEEMLRHRMASVLSKIYSVPVSKDNVLFTVGGRMGLSAIAYAINKVHSGKKVVTTYPVYPDHRVSYKGISPELVLVDTLNTQSLTAESLHRALKDHDPDSIGAFILSSPNNPMGWLVNKSEWKKISNILSQYKNSSIILDEAYAELALEEQHTSLVSVAPELRERITILRSATKGLSASGERMAILASWDSKMLSKMLEYQFTNLIHAPKSSQFAYTYAMEHFTEGDAKRLANFYRPLVRRVEKELSKAKLNFSNKKVSGTFYTIANLQELVGKPISNKVKFIYPGEKKIIEDDIDIAFHLMAEYKLALMPLSLLGVEPKKGLLRITCSLDDNEQQSLYKALHKIRLDLSKTS